MNEADGSEVLHFFRPLFLWDKNYVGRVEQAHVRASQIIYRIEDHHHVFLDNVPACPEEVSSVAIRPWRLVDWHLFNCLVNLLLREGLV